MGNIKRNVELYFLFMKLHLRQMIEYHMDFSVGIFSVILTQINTFLLTIIVFQQLDVLAGYSIMEIFLIYGFYIMLKGIDLFYNDNIWIFSWFKVREGSFSLILLRPINPIFYIVAEKVNINGITEFVIGLAIIIVSLIQLHISLNLLDLLILLLFVICGLIVYFSIKLLLSAPAFRTKSCGEFMTAVMQISDVAKYPVELYNNKIIKGLLLYVIPFPITSYIPALYCIQKVQNKRGIGGIYWFQVSSFLPYTLIISVALLIVSIYVWNRELKRYEPTGT